MLHHLIRTLSALTVFSSALIAAPDAKVVQETQKQTQRFLDDHHRTGLYLFGVSAVAAGMYAAYNYLTGQWTSAPDNACLFDNDRLTIAAVRMHLQDGKRFSEAEHYPQHLAELYNTILNCLASEAKNRIELACEVQELFKALVQNYAGYLVKHSEKSLLDAMQTLHTSINTNANGFENVKQEKITLIYCTFGQPKHITIAVHTECEVIGKLLRECAQILTRV